MCAEKTSCPVEYAASVRVPVRPTQKRCNCSKACTPATAAVFRVRRPHLNLLASIFATRVACRRSRRLRVALLLLEPLPKRTLPPLPRNPIGDTPGPRCSRFRPGARDTNPADCDRSEDVCDPLPIAAPAATTAVGMVCERWCHRRAGAFTCRPVHLARGGDTGTPPPPTPLAGLPPSPPRTAAAAAISTAERGRCLAGRKCANAELVTQAEKLMARTPPAAFAKAE